LRDEAGLKNYIEFLGYIRHDELPKYYGMADVFVFHSTYEAFGLVLTEAMAAAKPVVCTNVGSLPEVVENGRTGFVVEQKNPKALASAIAKLLGDPTLRASMGKAGLERSRKYDWDHICLSYLRLYRILSDRVC